jgi:hypothetical protein
MEIRLTESDSQVLRDLEGVVDEKIPQLRSIKGGTTIGMSSPSVASHHRTKLVTLELVEKRPDNSYEVSRVVKVGVLRNFIDFRGKFLLRYIFVAIFFTAYTLAFFALSLVNY